MKTPDDVAKMNEDFRRDVMDYEGPDALDRCKKYAKALVEVGDNQDELSGECRWVVKALRQKAGLLMAADPRMAPIAAEIRAAQAAGYCPGADPVLTASALSAMLEHFCYIWLGQGGEKDVPFDDDLALEALCSIWVKAVYWRADAG